jgi:hypothetical protein
LEIIFFFGAIFVHDLFFLNCFLKKVFATGLAQIMGMTNANDRFDIYAVVFNPGQLYRIPHNHASNPSLYAKTQLTLLTKEGAPVVGNALSSPIAVVRAISVDAALCWLCS